MYQTAKHGKTITKNSLGAFGLHNFLSDPIDVYLGIGVGLSVGATSGDSIPISAIAPMKTTWQALTTQDFKVVRTVPNLFRRQPGQPEPIHPLKRWLHHWCHSVWLNFKTGFAGVLTTWSLTLFPCVMWAIAWYTGWHISFTKLYEESATGSTLGFSGLLLFTGMMLYVPTAQARHAVTGDWRSFFDWRFVRAVLWQRPLHLLLLAIGYAIANIGLLVVKALPTFFTAINPTLEALSASEALGFLKDYYFFTGGLAFLVFLALRSWGAMIYGHAMLNLWLKADLTQDAFHPQEIHILEILEWPYGCRSQQSGLVKIILGIPLNLSYRGAILTMTVLVWSVFNFIPFVSEFANYYPGRGLLNQPLVQLPCFQYIPAQLKTAAKLTQESEL